MLIVDCYCQKSEFGNAIISHYQPIYEEDDNYFPHDKFLSSNLLDKPIEIINSKNILTIINKSNDGYTGHKVCINLNSNLKILDVAYDEWNDIVDGSKTKYKVEKIILTFNKNPFNDSIFTGYYTLQVRHDYEMESILQNSEVKDTSYYFIFNGKFKFYSATDYKKGKKWIIEQNELKYNIKDSSGVYFDVDKFAQFQLGDSTLMNILSNLTLDRKQVKEPLKSFVTLSFIVDKFGNIDLNKIRIREGLNSDSILRKIINEKKLWANWIPAEYKGVKVNSEVNLRIQIKN